jgi:phage host-nuclease inhibitor protein Gam
MKQALQPNTLDWSRFWQQEAQDQVEEVKLVIEQQVALMKLKDEYVTRLNTLTTDYKERYASLCSDHTCNINSLVDEVYCERFCDHQKGREWTHREICTIRDTIKYTKLDCRHSYMRYEAYDDFVDENEDAMKAARQNVNVEEYIRLQSQILKVLNARNTGLPVRKKILDNYDIDYDEEFGGCNQYFVRTKVTYAGNGSTRSIKDLPIQQRSNWIRVILQTERDEEEENKLTSEYHDQVMKLRAELEGTMGHLLYNQESQRKQLDVNQQDNLVKVVTQYKYRVEVDNSMFGLFEYIKRPRDYIKSKYLSRWC